MRSLRALLVVVLALPLVVAWSDDAGVDWSVAPGEGWTQTGSGWVSGDVEHVRTFPLDAGGAVDAARHDDLLYLTSYRSFSIYDVSDPLDPEPLSTVPLGPALWNEQPQTNGEILLISRDVQYLPPTEHRRGGGVLDIYDVSDPDDPSLTPIGTYESELTGLASTHRDHLWACVFACAYAYGAGGTILDLRDPTEPVKVGLWTDVAPVEQFTDHHIAEVAPGLVLTGSVPMYVLDVNAPAAPRVRATVDPGIWETPTSYAGTPRTFQNATALPGRVDWPGAPTGRLSVVTKETPFNGECDELSGDVETFVTSGWQGTRTFVSADTYRITDNGTYGDGAPPYNVLGCSAFGLDVHPSFDTQGGPIAVSFFEHGIRVLDIDSHGRITESGGFLPAAGNSMRPLWLDDEVLYVIDATRGIDILRLRTGGD